MTQRTQPPNFLRFIVIVVMSFNSKDAFTYFTNTWVYHFPTPDLIINKVMCGVFLWVCFSILFLVVNTLSITSFTVIFLYSGICFSPDFYVSLSTSFTLIKVPISHPMVLIEFRECKALSTLKAVFLWCLLWLSNTTQLKGISSSRSSKPVTGRSSCSGSSLGGALTTGFALLTAFLAAGGDTFTGFAS